MRRFIPLILGTAAFMLACASHYHLGILADLRNTNPAAILGGQAWNTVSWLLVLCLAVLEIVQLAVLVRKK
ncbi:MAG: hypothetical protein ACI3WR_00700 [Oscillospiraceae bacterium]